MNGATFCTFTYLAPLVTEVTGLGSGWVPVVLALFGIGSFVGVGLGGRVADARPMPLLVCGSLALLTGWVLCAVTAGSPVAVLVLVLVQGALSFAVGSTLIAQALYAATDAPTLAGGFATAAFNVGGALGPWCGGPPRSPRGSATAPRCGGSALLVAAATAIGGRGARPEPTRAPGGGGRGGDAAGR